MRFGSLTDYAPFNVQDKGKWVYEEDHGGSSTRQVKHLVVDAATASGTGTITLTVAAFIPANSIVYGMTARVITVLAGSGLTTWGLGVTGTTDKYGTGLAKTVGTTVKPSDHKSTVAGPHYQAAAIDVLLTGAAGVFSTGQVRLVLWYETITAPTQ